MVMLHDRGSGMRKLGSHPRLCWPFRIKPRLIASAPAVSDRLAGPVAGPALRAFNPMRFSFLSDAQPAGMSKRIEFRSPLVCRDAQRRADKLGRHAQGL
jgi:hypothetical protein